MKQMLKRLLLAGEHNNHHPHILRETAALGVIAIFILILAGISGVPNLLYKNGMLGEVYPAVVASLTNQGREAQALSDLKRNAVLDQAARNKAEDMVARGYFAHKSPDGRQPWDWIREGGYQYEYAGENLAINYNDSIDVYTAWMNSPTHKANILNSHYTEIGIGIATTTIDGRESVLVVQMFGSPKYPSKISSNTPLTTPTSISANISSTNAQTNNSTNTSMSTRVTNNINSSSSATSSLFAGKASSSTNILGATIEGDKIYENDPLTGSVVDIASISNTDLNDDSNVNSIKDSDMASNIEGDSRLNAEANAQNVNDFSFAAFLGAITTNSRHISLIIYGIFILLLNISVISLGKAEYKKDHKKALFIALLLLCLISLLSYVYVYMKAAEVILT